MPDVKKVAQEKNGTSTNYKKKKKKKKKYLKKKKRNKWLSMKNEQWVRGKNINKRKRSLINCLLKSAIMKCLCTGDQLRWMDEMATFGLGRTRHRMATDNTNQVDPDEYTIEQAESNLREAADLNHEEARALLGRMEFLKGHKEAALSLYDGIDFRGAIPKMKAMLSSLSADPQKQHSRQSGEPPMQFSAVVLRLESLYLKSMALHDLGRYKDAAEECSMILDIAESALPNGLHRGSSVNQNKLHELVCNAAEFLPELHKLAGSTQEAISSYRQVLLTNWHLDPATVTSIQKDFAILLLYGGCEANSPGLRYQNGGSFVPTNNLEEAILLLMILLRKCNTKQIEWDPSVVQHLTFALSMSSQWEVLAREYEEILPSMLEKKERLHSLALCYFNEENDETALRLLRQMVDSREVNSGSLDPVILRSWLLASKFCSDKTQYAKEAADFAKRAIAQSHKFQWSDVESIGERLLGISLSTQARFTSSDSDRVKLQKDALEALLNAEKKCGNDPDVLQMLALEYAEERKLDEALKYAKRVMKLKFGSDVNVWILLARIFSAQKRYAEAESVVNAGLGETGKWDQLGLLRTKAKIYISQRQFKNAIETCTQILAVIQLRTRTFGAAMKFLKGINNDRTIEMETWYDLAHVYLSMKQLKDVELCLSRLKAIRSYSSLYWHATGKLHETRGLVSEALGAYNKALDLDPGHVPSILSLAILLRQLGNRPLPVVRSLLTEALRLDRTNHVAWFQLGLLHEDEGTASAVESAECFQAAALLEETAPVEPFR
ncbi:no pollen germination related 2 [Rhynchospora pubera]|uniref:No pollen germination related 2 n=1 Tax=Rhynchospora pubera TaxID=906938 RepID=A0AAV8DYG7_9POAL|nr:no pollen germination related 2 [Rhynchospora pubera]